MNVDDLISERKDRSSIWGVGAVIHAHQVRHGGIIGNKYASYALAVTLHMLPAAFSYLEAQPIHLRVRSQIIFQIMELMRNKAMHTKDKGNLQRH